MSRRPPPDRPRRSVAARAGLLLIALTVGSVGGAGCARDDALLVVNGWTLSRADFLSELDQLARNQGYLAARAGTGQPFKVFKDGSTTEYAPEFVVEFLNERVTFQLAAAELVKRGLTITDADRAKAVEVIDEGLAPEPGPDQATVGGTTGTTGTKGTTGSTPGPAPPASAAAASVLDGFGSYRDVLVTGVASLQVLQRALSTDVSTDDGLRSLYDQMKDQYATQACVRHILVQANGGGLDPVTGAPVVPTDPEYAAVLTKVLDLEVQIRSGADFATVAAASSDDEATKEKGGDLGCAPKGSYDQAFDDAVWAAPIGQVTDPVQSTYGYHLILVTDRRTMTFDEMKDTLRAAVDSRGEQALQEWLTQASRDATVIVDPGVGKWNAATGVIDPPGGATTVTLVPDGQGTVPSTEPLVPPGTAR